MKLQLALDRLSREQCFRMVQETAEFVDWIEIGTGVIKQYGMDIVRSMKERYPEKTIVADMKTCDAGKHEAVQAFSAGADITTVMAFSAERTVADALEAAVRHGCRVMIDLLNMTDAAVMSRLERLGADLYSLHRGKDMQADSAAARHSLFPALASLRGELAVAGGINAASLPTVAKMRPHIVIVGEAITQSESPGETAAKLKEVIAQYERTPESGS